MHFGHGKLKFPILVYLLLVLSQNGRLLSQLQVVIIHLRQRKSFVSCLWYNVFLNPLSIAAFQFECFCVDRLL